MSIVTLTFDLWPSKSIGCILSSRLTCLPSLMKKTQRFSLYGVHKLISIYVHYDLDLWPSKSIGFILSPWLTCLPSLIKKSTTVKSLLHSQAYFHRCPLWPWPLTSKINRVHPLITVNMSAKFDEEAHNGLVSMVFTSLFPYMSIMTLTFDLQNQ